MNNIPNRAVTILTTGIALTFLTFSLFVHGLNIDQAKKEEAKD